MPAQVTLQVVRGPLTGREVVFDERNTCLVGRGEDCDERLRLPSDELHKTISRNHCLLDVNPPDIRVRDFGSKNGTFVNGRKIGQRREGQTPEEGAQSHFPEHDLKDSDEIKLGQTVFRISVQAPEPPDTLRKCGVCGKGIARDAASLRQGVLVCSSCQADPKQIIGRLLGLAGSGQPDLAAIRGYTILKELGHGGMGAVYLAQHDTSGERVALKIMLPKVAADERAQGMFLRETENTKALRHPNVVNLRDSGCANGTFYFTLEFCDGGSVDKLMKARGGTLSVDEALRIVLQALDGLEYAHQAEMPQVKLSGGGYGKGRGLVHRDLKPANIFLSGTGRARVAKVADFGLAKAFDQAGLSGQTATGNTAGTPYFMPRQQVVNFKYAKPDVDVWAMAASLYNMLTGCVPRTFVKGGEVWQTVLQTDAAPILSRGCAIPPRLAKVIDEALVDKPDIRFKSAAEFKRALEGAIR